MGNKVSLYEWCLLEPNIEFGQRILNNFVGCVNPSDDFMKLTTGSKKKIILHCDLCNTNFETYPKLLSQKVWHGCKDGKVVIPGYNDLLTYCLSDIEKYAHVIKGWREDLNGSMYLYAPQANKKVFFTCEKCGYTWDVVLADVISKGRWCPVESGHRVLKGYNDFETYCHKLEKEKCDRILNSWSTKNDFLPSETTIGKHIKLYFKCIDCGTEFSSTPSDILAGHWCPECMKTTQTSTPEQIIYLWLKSHFKQVLNRYKMEGNEADIYVADLNLVIEYQSGWHKGHEKRDMDKLSYFRGHGCNVLWVGTYNPGINESNFILHKNPNTKDSNCNKLIKDISKWLLNMYNIQIDPTITVDVLREARENSKNVAYENSLEYWCKNKANKQLGQQILEGWDYEQNAKEGLDMKSVTSGSNMKAWFKCKKGHSWYANIYNVTHTSWCPYCNKGHGAKKIKYVS